MKGLRMPVKKYRVDLTAQERDTLLSRLRSGKTAAREMLRARILLKAEEGLRMKRLPRRSPPVARRSNARASALWKRVSGH